MTKKILALALVFLLCLSVLSLGVLAAPQSEETAGILEAEEAEVEESVAAEEFSAAVADEMPAEEEEPAAEEAPAETEDDEAEETPTQITDEVVVSGGIQMLAPGDAPGGSGGGPGGGSSNSVDHGSAATTINTNGTYSYQTYTTSTSDYNALRVDSATVTLDHITVNKTGNTSSSSSETNDWYGMNAAFLAVDGANVTIRDSEFYSNASGGNGVFTYGTAVVNIYDSTITTMSNNSGGLMTTKGGTTNAYNLTVTTSGGSAAAIRSDSGGGTITVDGGTYTTNGGNSPAIYCTADITVSNADLIANSSEAICIEGLNSVKLYNCYLSGNETQGNSMRINTHSIMIYQSMSADYVSGTSTFEMHGGTLVNNNGDVIFVTNTDCVITLENVNIINNSTNSTFKNLFTIKGNDASNGWGTAGKNGGEATITASNQVLEGTIEVDTISKMDLTLRNGSTLTGKINIVDNADGGSDIGTNAVLTIDSTSTWELTGNSTLSSITANGGTIFYNGYTITMENGTVYSESNPVPGSIVGSYEPLVPTGISGDVSADGNVNISDVQLLLKYVNGQNVRIVEDACDIDGSGSVNISDVQLLLKYVNGQGVTIN